MIDVDVLHRNIEGLKQAIETLHRATDDERVRWQEALEASRAREAALRSALAAVRYGCLMDIRRAAFGPEIGVRYKEEIRLKIAEQCWRLELFIDETLRADS